MTFSVSILISLISGLLMGLAPEPWGIWPLAWIALAPLWVLVTQPHANPRRLGLGCAAAWGVGYHGLALFWITGVHPMTWLGVPWLASLAIALVCWVLITGWGVALVVSWAWLFQRILLKLNPKSIGIRVLLGVTLWCGLETLWSHSPLWWSSLSYTQSFRNLMILHLGQLSGPTTVTAVIVCVNGFLAEIWKMIRVESSLTGKNLGQNFSQHLLRLLVPVGICLMAHGVGFLLYSQPLNINPSQALKIGIIQGNIPNEIKLGSSGWRKALAGYTMGYQSLADRGADAVLTPETALPFLWTQHNRELSSFYQAILDKGVLAWVGSFGSKGQALTNSLFTVTGDGAVVSQYDKVYLVPLGEYIPLSQVFGQLINRLSPLQADLVPGQPGQVLDTPLGQAIAGICYDSAFSQHFRQQARSGGEFILTASNNAHYAPAMLAQHHAQDVMRAIETDRWTVRATNTGYSAVVNPHGQTLWKSQKDSYAIHLTEIYRQQNQTWYVRWGDWLLPLLFVGSITVILLNFAL